VPIYHFVARAPDGSLVQLPIPTVAGTGPPYSNTPPPIIDNSATPGAPTFTSHYAGYWRLYTVGAAAGGARVRAARRPEIRDGARRRAGVPQDAMYSTEIMQATAAQVGGPPDGGAQPGLFRSRARRPRSHQRQPRTPGPCRWLDSQQHIEELVPAALIQRTNVTVTCPFVSFRGQAVVP
jgi:hypothetical protein